MATQDPQAALEQALPDRPVTSTEAIGALVRSDGDLMAASVLLKTKQANILTALVQDQNNANLLAGYLRTFMTLKTITTISEMHQRVIDQMDDLNPRDLTSQYVKLMAVFSNLTADSDPANNANSNSSPFDVLLKSVPPNVRSAMIRLANSQNPRANANSQEREASG